MRKFGVLWMLMLTGLFLTGGCLKRSTSAPCTPKTVEQDEPLILAYLSANNITGYKKHSSGLYYKIDSTGYGAAPNASSKVYVTYTGRFTDNTVFETKTASETGWILGTLVQGWQTGLTLIGKGGRIHLYMPSVLGYGCQAAGPVPANSVLVFDILLVDVT
jgi:FKBP-type peptidyl-prolyl cis-trans isomerase FkpA